MSESLENNAGAVLRGGAWMVAACAGAAVMAVSVRQATSDLHPLQVAFLRAAIALPLVALVAANARRRGRSLRLRRAGLHGIRALFVLASMVCFFSALSLMPVAEATALILTAPLFGTIGAALFLGERVWLRRWAAVLAGFAGALLVLRPEAAGLTLGALLALAAALAAAGDLLLLKTLTRTESPEAVVLFLTVVLSTCAAVPAAFVWQAPPTDAWPWLFGAALGGTAGQLFMGRALAEAALSVLYPLQYAALVFAAVLGYLLFGEVPAIATWIGGLAIVAASAYVVHREHRIARLAAARSQRRGDMP